MFGKKEITKKSKDFSRWYADVVLKAELADYAPVRGCMVIRPYGFALWENIQKNLDEMIKKARIENAYFPLFIPHSFLKKEAEHVKGFSPQLAVVTHGGGKKLAEPLVVRPTSETVMYEMFSKWIKSWRDLPLLLNQWCNIVRWEMRTYLFLRTLEFLWQEGHTAHATQAEAEEEALRALKMYQKFVEDFLAIPVLVGKKSESEKFPGAKTTYTIEALMTDKKALQAGTSHELGQNFAKPFEIKFQDKKGKLQYVWQTSWGMTTRIIGALVMVHGDDNGLILPPKVAPIQVVIIPIPSTPPCVKYARKVAEMLQKDGIRVKVDDRKECTPGYKFNQWELKGVPLRIEIGEKEVKDDYLTVCRRDKLNEKLKIKNEKLKIKIKKLLEEVQRNLFKRAQKFLETNTYDVSTWEEFKKIMSEKKGFIKAFWCEDPHCEEKIKEETKATARLLPLEAEKLSGRCIYCGQPASYQWYFAQAY